MPSHPDTTSCVIGLLWGDEGKGKIIDLFARDADVVARYGGGHNAGHTLVHEGERLVLHLIPSAILHAGAVNVIGNGVVVDPFHLKQEVEKVRGHGAVIELGRNLLVSSGCHLILPLHRALDAAAEKSRGDAKIGTTGRGIGPTYADRAARCGIRAGDLLRPERLRRGLERLCNEKNTVLEACGIETIDQASLERDLLAIGDWLAPAICDGGQFLRSAWRDGKKILFEGAQGVLLDVDHGTYPFVTSSSASTGGIAVGTGMPPQSVGDVVGVCKAYATRVGSGPFPTELDGEIAERIRAAGNEYGSTTGRPRRCGWFDAVAVRYAVQVSGTTEIALTMLDVLSGFEQIGIATSYARADGSRTHAFDPFELDDVEAGFEYVPGFDADLRGVRAFGDLPAEAQAFVARVEDLVGVPVKTVSVGPGRDEVIRR